MGCLALQELKEIILAKTFWGHSKFIKILVIIIFLGKLTEKETRTLQEHKSTLTTRKAILSNKPLSISIAYIIFNIK